MIDQPTTLEAILSAREKRAERHKTLLASHSKATLISLTINTPGIIKLSHEALVIFEEAQEAILSALAHQLIPVIEQVSSIEITGVEWFCLCQQEAVVLKKLVCDIENAHPLGRFMDIDVLDTSLHPISRTMIGFERRRCFVCNDDAKVCARAQKHDYATLNHAIQQSVKRYVWEHWIALWCKRAMLTEVELTPKPGLVDRANSGAHHDMDIQTFYRSCEAIYPFIRLFLTEARNNCDETPKMVFIRMRRIGIACEKAMFEATSGVNTHKGMIFCLAVLCGACGQLRGLQKPLTMDNLQSTIKAMCDSLVEEDMLKTPPKSAGERFYAETKSTGIRGIAQSGFGVIFEKSLPYFRAQKSSFGEEVALQKTLLFLISFLEDSTLWHRGGMSGLQYAQIRAQTMLNESSEMSLHEALQAFDKEMIFKNLSPGGSADLLAITWLCEQIVES